MANTKKSGGKKTAKYEVKMEDMSVVDNFLNEAVSDAGTEMSMPEKKKQYRKSKKNEEIPNEETVKKEIEETVEKEIEEIVETSGQWLSGTFENIKKETESPLNEEEDYCDESEEHCDVYGFIHDLETEDIIQLINKLKDELISRGCVQEECSNCDILQNSVVAYDDYESKSVDIEPMEELLETDEEPAEGKKTEPEENTEKKINFVTNYMGMHYD